jgi:hypothetical protein
MDKTVEMISSNIFAKLYARLVRLGRAEKEDPSDTMKREFKYSSQHGLWSTVDMVETVDEVAMAKEIVTEVPVQWCLGRHQRLVLARI